MAGGVVYFAGKKDMGEHYEYHGSKTVKVIADISDIEFGYLSSFVADPELSASKELTNRVLKKVLVRLGAEDKILCEGDHILWNTGIPSHSGCKIIGYGKIDSSGTLRIIKFAESQSGIMTGWLDRFGSMPEAMDFTDIEEHFNPNYPVRLSLQHILVDRYYILPKEYQEFLGIVCEKDTLQENVARIEEYVKFSTMVLEGSILKTLRQIKEMPTIPVRFWNSRTERMDWMIPVDMGVKLQSIIALVLTLKEEGDQRYYQGYTILDLKTAYSNARLANPILSNWLRWEE